MESRRSKLVAVAVIATFVAGLVFTITRGERSRDLVLGIEPIDPSQDVTVYLGGAVEEPGLYSLPRGSRLSEAVDLAGTIESSDISGLDLGSVLEDEQTVIVPELAVADPDGVIAPVDVGGSTGMSINVNEADVDQLQLLPGIGPALAERIIEHRESTGLFQSLDELENVSGISSRMVDEIRDTASVSD